MTSATHLTDLDEAVAILKKGGLVLYPTETYFGIGCRVGSDEAIARIFKVKKRLYAMPLPIILGSPEQMDMVAAPSPSLREDLDALAAAFWPGPLSVIMPARAHISPLLTGGTGNIAMRVSPHPVPTQLALGAGEPVVASSANISGQPPVTGAQELSPELVRSADAVLDLPPAPCGGAPSTLVALLGGRRINILRQGAVSLERLEEAGFRQE